MKTRLLVAAAAIGAAGFASAALAHEMDVDADGLYSLTEMRSEYPDMSEAEYAALDTNQDGALDAAELDAAWADGRLAAMDDD